MALPGPPHPERHSWLDHPVVAAHYRQRALVDGRPWEAVVAEGHGGVIPRALQLWSGNGARSFSLYEQGLARSIDGIDANEAVTDQAEAAREVCRAPGVFRVADVNSVRLPTGHYGLVFVCHGLHQAVALEHLLDQVHATLIPGGWFVIEGYVGPSRFQWTDEQIALVRMLTGWLPDHLRVLPWGALKPYEGRPDRSAVAAASMFESIRSGEIVSAVESRFEVQATRLLGGTLQHLLYNGIIQNFADIDAGAQHFIGQAMMLEDTLIDTGLLPSDFRLIVARKR